MNTLLHAKIVITGIIAPKMSPAQRLIMNDQHRTELNLILDFYININRLINYIFNYIIVYHNNHGSIFKLVQDKNEINLIDNKVLL